MEITYECSYKFKVTETDTEIIIHGTANGHPEKRFSKLEYKIVLSPGYKYTIYRLYTNLVYQCSNMFSVTETDTEISIYDSEYPEKSFSKPEHKIVESGCRFFVYRRE